MDHLNEDSLYFVFFAILLVVQVVKAFFKKKGSSLEDELGDLLPEVDTVQEEIRKKIIQRTQPPKEPSVQKEQPVITYRKPVDSSNAPQKAAITVPKEPLVSTVSAPWFDKFKNLKESQKALLYHEVFKRNTEV